MDSLLFKEKQFQYLAYLLKVNDGELEKILDNIGDYYYSYQEKKCDKKTGKPKTYLDGTVKKRTITPSIGSLKKIQKTIKRAILDEIHMPDHVHGAVKGKSNITNAKIHQGKKYRFVTDLKDFFPTVSHEMVFSFFLSVGYSNHISSWLTKLTTYKGCLPQGTSTSPALANFCFLKIDQGILSFCKNEGITYSRFVDDLTFSSAVNFKDKISFILKKITDNGFKISYRKTSFGTNQKVTGLIVSNNYIDVPDDVKEKARLILDHNGYVVYLNNVRNTNKNMIYSGDKKQKDIFF